MTKPTEVNKTGAKPAKTEDPAVAAQREIFQQLKIDPERLGAKGKAESKAILAELKKLGQSGINDKVLGDMLVRLREATALDKAAAFSPGPTPTGKNAFIPDLKQFLLEVKDPKTKETTHQLGGAVGESHALSKLLKRLGLDPKNLDPNVVQVMHDILPSQKGGPISSEAYNKLALALAGIAAKKEAAAGATSPSATPKTAPANGVNKVLKADSKNGAVPKGPIDDSSQTRNPALSARATEGSRGASSPLQTLMSNLGAFNAKKKDDPAAQEAIGKIIDELAKEAGVEKLSAEDRKKLEGVLSQVVKDSESKDGTIRDSMLMANTFAALSKLEQGRTGQPGIYDTAAAMTRAMHLAMGESPAKPGLKAAFNHLAAVGLIGLTGEALGKPSKELSGDLLGKMGGILKQIGKQEDKQMAGDVDRAMRPNSPAARAAQRAANKALNDEVKLNKETEKQASQAVAKLGIDPQTPQGQQLVKVYSQIFKDAKTPADAIRAANGFVNDRLGLVTGFSRAEEGALRSGMIPPDAVGMMAERALNRVAELVLDPHGFVQRNADAINHAGSAQAMPPGGGPPINIHNVDLKNLPQFGVPGISGTGNPKDAANNRKAQLYAQRSMVISSILHDPSLSIEDKIFLFMMWFAAFADQERMHKMEEIAELDRIDAQKNEQKNLRQREKDAQTEMRTQIQSGIDIAEKDLAKAEGGGDKIQIDAAKAKLEECKGALGQCNGKIDQLTKEYDSLKNETDQGTKSREILLFELDRITQLRGSVMDMARHFLEDSTRRIKEIMR